MCHYLGLGHESLRVMLFYVLFEDSMQLSDYNLCYMKHIQDYGKIQAKEGEVDMKYMSGDGTVAVLLPGFAINW